MPVVAIGERLGQSLCLHGRQPAKAKQDDAARRGPLESEDDIAEIGVRCDENPVFSRGSIEHLGIVTFRRIAPNPGGSWPSRRSPSTTARGMFSSARKRMPRYARSG